jgi:hypothetical protein
MPSTTLPPKDPRALVAVWSSTSPTYPEQAQTAAELLRIVNAWDTGTRERGELRDLAIDYRSEYTREAAGHKPFPYDIPDDLANLHGIFTTVVDAAPLLGLAGGPFGYEIAKEAADPLKRISDVAADIAAIPGLQQIVGDWRARNGAAAVAEITDANARYFEAAVATIADRVRKDSTGQLLQALKDAFPKVFTPGMSSVAPGACVSEHPEVFNQYSTTIVVKADNSVVLTDIDSTRTQILTSVSAVGTQVQAGFVAVGKQLEVINQQNQQIAAGVAGIAKFLKDQAAHQEQREKAEAARKNAADTMTAIWSAAQGTVTGAAAVASLLGDKKLAGEITRYGTGVVTIAKSVVAFAEAMSALSKGLTALSSLGAAAATSTTGSTST